jgi:hypothetical protein
MKAKYITTLTILVLSTLLYAEDARYETVTASLPPGVGSLNSTTNSITIADYETGELIDGSGDGYTQVNLYKDGCQFSTVAARNNNPGVGSKVRGPATFQLTISAGNNSSDISRYMTVKITPVSFPPDKTLIVPPGTNQVQISLETSTNLVNWSSATNGVYGSPNAAQFFRLKMTPLN